ncbi:MAG: hypothetical protein Fur005_22320 [Roseiflexaceae bacterium]
MQHSMQDRRFALLGLPLIALILACSGGAVLPAERAARWACPSPTPKPWGEQGPIKGYRDGQLDPTTGIPKQEPIYYQQWEQEYGHHGPPFPSPTPYALKGNSYAFGQRIEIWPVHARLMVESGTIVADQQLQWIALEWINHSEHPIPIDYVQQITIQEIITPQGAYSQARPWQINATALELAGITQLPTAIPVGTSMVRLPFLTIPGTPHVVSMLVTPATQPLGQPTPTPAANRDLQATEPSYQRILWRDTVPLLGNAPPCSHPGATTDWHGEAWGIDGPVVGPAPPGTNRVIAIALRQVGKPYQWGAAGPERFDCQGLIVWSYAQIGIRVIGHSATQYAKLRPISFEQLQPGDLLFFDTREPWRGSPEQVSHVGMVADLNQDGRWDMIHAASTELGVRIDWDIFAHPYYRPRLMPEARTVR